MIYLINPIKNKMKTKKINDAFKSHIDDLKNRITSWECIPKNEVDYNKVAGLISNHSISLFSTENFIFLSTGVKRDVPVLTSIK